MKRATFIIIGAIIVLILVAVWLYLLFFPAPADNGGMFANFGFGGTDETSYVEDTNTSVADTVVDTTSKERLRQLTTVPVLAYREVQMTASSTPQIYYVEAGTGHIFSINYETGQTTRLSATTIPVATKAALSPNGQFVMYRSGDTAGAEYIVGNLATSSEKITTTVISENVVDFVIPNNNEILYSVQLQNSLVGKRYSLKTGAVSTLFTIPFREAAVAWGKSSDATHYVYPRATDQLQGFIYKIKGGVLTRLPISGYGVSAVGTDADLLYSSVVTTQTNRIYVSQGLQIADYSPAAVPFTVMPEKCTASSHGTYYCATQLNLESIPNLPDDWYRGQVTFSDSVWEFNLETGSAYSLFDMRTLSGRDADIVNITPNNSQTRLYFTDRYNKLLWVYELTQE